MPSRKSNSPPWKVALTDKFIHALKVREGKERDQVQDTVVPKLYVRVTASGVKTFAVAALLQAKKGKKAKEKLGKHAARHALASVRRLFNWAFDRERITTLPHPSLVRQQDVGDHATHSATPAGAEG
jgi:hypothetical protein